MQQNKKKAEAEDKNCHAKTMWSQEKPIQLVWKAPHMCRSGKSPRRNTREGTKSGAARLGRMKRGRGMNGRDDKSSGIEIRMTDALAKINPTDPLILA